MKKHFFCLLLLLFSLSSFSQDLMPRMDGSNNKYGYVDPQGNWIIKAQYDHASTFVNEYAIVMLQEKKDGKILCQYGFIDKKGKERVHPKYPQVGSFQDGLFRVQQKDGSWIFLNAKGKKAFKKSFYYAGDFYNGMAVVAVKDAQTGTKKYGYINTKGKEIVTPRFYYAYNFRDGYGKVAVGESFDTAQYGCVDTDGKLVIGCMFSAEAIDLEIAKLLSEEE